MRASVCSDNWTGAFFVAEQTCLILPRMSFKAAKIDFASTSLQSLATSNGRAYLKGSGKVNGSGNYTFLAIGIDVSVIGGNNLIRFQIKDASNNVIYDSQPGAGDTTDPTTVVATGNIRVH